MDSLVIPSQLFDAIRDYERLRAAWAELPLGSPRGTELALRGQALFAGIVATQATDLFTLRWKVAELVEMVRERGEPGEVALADSLERDMRGFATMVVLPPMPRLAVEEQAAPRQEGETFTFRFDGHEIRVVIRGGDPWFVAADVCRAVGIVNPTQATGALDADERAMFNIGRAGAANIISESGLYTLVLRSRSAVKEGTLSHRFRRWVTTEVLPALRRTGAYAGTAPSAPSTPPAQPSEAPQSPLALACPLARGKRPYMPRAINMTPEEAAERAIKAAKQRRARRQAGEE